jgi:hypothetical protein
MASNAPSPAASPTLRRVSAAVQLAILAVLAYVPMLATEPGRLAADTKQYLYLDPGRLLDAALSSWDPSVAGGTVTHQQIGFLFPQGPFYWLLAELHVPLWVAQRLWYGSLLFAAGAGVWYLARLLGLAAGPGPGAAAVAAGPARDGSSSRIRFALVDAAPLAAGAVYMLSPYFLQYSQRLSAVALPWSGLGWMMAFTVRTLRGDKWRFVALFGLVVAVVGGTNATALLYVGLAPLIYLIYGAFVSREATPRQAGAAFLRLGVVSAALSLWWVSALWVEGSYGTNVLKYTETIPTIAATSAPAEVLRGLGYWLFYGGSAISRWVTASVGYETEDWLILLSFAIPVLAIVSGVLVRWRQRGYFALLILIGMALSVGSFPYTGPGLIGRAVRAFMNDTTAGSALRSTDRATPLVLLGISMLIGAGAAALTRAVPVPGPVRAANVDGGNRRVAAKRLRLALLASAPVGLAVCVAMVNGVPLLSGGAVDASYTRPDSIPSYMQKAADFLDAAGDATRVLIEPGQNFAVYDFGATDDPVWPGLMTRPTILRQQTIDGTAPTTDLLGAFDETLQEGTFEPSTLAPIARLLSAGDVLLQSNLAYWWYVTPTPKETWALLEPPPAGIGKPVAFGPPVPDDAPRQFQDLDTAELALPADAPSPPAVAVFPVTSPRSIYRAEPATAPLLVDGSGAGLVAAAATGLLDDSPTIFYAASMADDAALAREALVPGSELVVTDTNAKVLRLWNTNTLQADTGEVETAEAAPTVANPSYQPLDVFPDAPPNAYTTASYSGAVDVTASSYGSPFVLTPANRPYSAFDGDAKTAWTVPAAAAAGSWIQVELSSPTAANHIDLVQYQQGAPWITKATLSFDGASPLTVTLGPASHKKSGQVLSFPARRFRTLRITIDATDATAGQLTGSVGLAEVRIPGVTIRESYALPTDLLSRLGASSRAHRLVLLMSRDRVGSSAVVVDTEDSMSRTFVLPTARTFTLSGAARLGPIGDEQVDSLLSGRKPFQGSLFSSSSHLAGDPNSRAVFAFDGDPHTAWTTTVGPGGQQDAWIQMELPHALTIDRLDLQVVADGRHSVPTELRITSNKGSDVVVPLPPIRDRSAAGATVTLHLHFRAVSGSDIRFTVVHYRAVESSDYEGSNRAVLPISIAEVGVPGVRAVPERPSAQLPGRCVDDLLQIDGHPIDVRVTGTVGAAESLSGLEISGCGPDAHGVLLGAGTHLLETAPGSATGWNLDRVVLDSAAGGGPTPLGPSGTLQSAPGTLASAGQPALAAPAVRVLSSTASGASVEVTGADKPFWLVLGESQDAGWQASIAGGGSLGASQLTDGMSNGWYVVPPAGSHSFFVDISFGPQHFVWVGLALSGGALVACVLVAVWPRRRRFVLGRRRKKPAVVPVADRSGDPGPHVANPFIASGRRPGWVFVLAVAAGAGIVGAAVPAPPWAPVIGASLALAVGAALLWPRARALLTIGAVVSACGVAADVAISEAVSRFAASSNWPASFPLADVLAWIAVVALTADVVVEVTRSAGDGAPLRPARKARRERSRPS